MKTHFKINQSWFYFWILSPVLAGFLSILGGYAAGVLVLIFFPLFQFFSLLVIEAGRWKAVWLLQIPFCFLFLWLIYQLRMDDKLWIIWGGYVLFGELLLAIIFNRFGKGLWTLANGLGIAVFYLAYMFLDLFNHNDFAEILITIIAFIAYMALTGVALYKAFLETENK